MNPRGDAPACDNLGTFAGTAGRERLRQEMEALLEHQPRAVVAMEGLPGAGKTYLMKHIVRFGFGPFGRHDITVIDDNIRYGVRLWRLHWTKLTIDKSSWPALVADMASRVIFFSNWVPSRYIPAADLVVRLKTGDEGTRMNRLRQRYRREPKKAALQSRKGDLPWEMPFACPREMTIVDACRGIVAWELTWLVRRCLSRKIPPAPL